MFTPLSGIIPCELLAMVAAAAMAAVGVAVAVVGIRSDSESRGAGWQAVVNQDSRAARVPGLSPASASARAMRRN